MKNTLEKLDFLLERTPHGVLEILLQNLEEKNAIESGIPALDDFLNENFEDDLTFLTAFLELEYGNLNNLMSCFKDDNEEE